MLLASSILRVPEILDALESFYGAQEPHWPTDPYEFLVWWHCGYPASDAACARPFPVFLPALGAGGGSRPIARRAARA